MNGDLTLTVALDGEALRTVSVAFSFRDGYVPKNVIGTAEFEDALAEASRQIVSSPPLPDAVLFPNARKRAQELAAVGRDWRSEPGFTVEEE